MIGIGNLDIDKLYVGNDDVEKVYLGNDLVWQQSVIPTDDTVLRVSTQSTTTVTMNIYKVNATETQIYLNNTLHTTSTTSGTQDISVDIPIGISTIKISGGEFYFDSYCLGSQTKNALLTNISFGSNYGNNIGQYAFRNCSGLTNITIPNSVTSIGLYAFRNCLALTSIIIGRGVTSIGNSAFRDCTNLTDINWNAANVADFTLNSYIFYNAGILGNGITVTFGESVQRIPPYLFYISNSSYRPNIVSVTIGSNVTSIGERAFEECNNITAINWNAVNATTPTTNSSIFYNAGTAGNGIVVTFGESVQSIPVYLLYGANISTALIIPNSVTSIGNYAFRGCSGLTGVTIGNGVTSIGVGAFLSCSGLTDITINATTPPALTDVSAFEYTNNCPIYVPASSINAYKSATNWSNLASRIQAIIT